MLTARLSSSERRARTHMDAVPERDVLARVHAVELKLVGSLENPRVPVRRPGEHHDGVAGGEVDAADGRRDT